MSWLGDRLWGRGNLEPQFRMALRSEAWFWKRNIRAPRNTKPRPLRRNLHGWTKLD